MILDFLSFSINESVRKLKKELHGTLNAEDRKKMRKLLRHNIVTFKFIKRNGEIRKAKGTLNAKYTPALRGGDPRPEHQMVYYDFDKDGWRSFRSYKFIKILDIKPIDSTPTSGTSSSSSSSKPSKHIPSKPIHSKPPHPKPEDDEDEDKIEKKPIHKENEEKKEDEKTKTYKAGEKIPEEELTRRSADFRKGSRKNKTTHEANDKFKKEKHKDEENDEDK